MSIISMEIAALYNGISQRPATLRDSSQATQQVNAVSSPAEGLRKRPGTRHIARVADNTAEVAAHFISRDNAEEYAVVADGQTLKVVELATGQLHSVSTPDGTSYITTDTPREDLRFITAADATFVLNTKRPVQMRAELVDDADSLSGIVSFPVPAILPSPEEPADEVEEEDIPSTGRTVRNTNIPRNTPASEPYEPPKDDEEGEEGEGEGDGEGEGETPDETPDPDPVDPSDPAATVPDAPEGFDAYDTYLSSLIGLDGYAVISRLPLTFTVGTPVVYSGTLDTSTNAMLFPSDATFYGRTMEEFLAFIKDTMVSRGYQNPAHIGGTFPLMFLDGAFDNATAQQWVTSTSNALGYSTGSSVVVRNCVSFGAFFALTLTNSTTGRSTTALIPVRVSYAGAPSQFDADKGGNSLLMKCGEAGNYYTEGKFKFSKTTSDFTEPIDFMLGSLPYRSANGTRIYITGSELTVSAHSAVMPVGQTLSDPAAVRSITKMAYTAPLTVRVVKIADYNPADYPDKVLVINSALQTVNV